MNDLPEFDPAAGLEKEREFHRVIPQGKAISIRVAIPGWALAAVLALSGMRAEAFSLLGPYTDWMKASIGYRQNGDLGGPMDFDEGYRWNKCRERRLAAGG